MKKTCTKNSRLQFGIGAMTHIRHMGITPKICIDVWRCHLCQKKGSNQTMLVHMDELIFTTNFTFLERMVFYFACPQEVKKLFILNCGSMCPLVQRSLNFEFICVAGKKYESRQYKAQIFTIVRFKKYKTKRYSSSLLGFAFLL